MLIGPKVVNPIITRTIMVSNHNHIDQVLLIDSVVGIMARVMIGMGGRLGLMSGGCGGGS